jgi:lysophospholipid acyltransferase (LPLAT)-like uncharacterized protein
LKFRKPWQHRWIGRLGAVVLRLLGATWRRRLIGVEDPEPAIYIFLHGDILLAAHLHRDRHHAILISTHRDGEIIAQVAQRLGFDVIRGSSTRGGTRAVLEILRNMSGRRVAVTPDGPRGPRGKVEPGLIQLAAKAGWKIYPLGFAVSRAWRARSWDRFAIPWPFARIVCRLGEPLVPPREPDRETCARLAEQASRLLFEAEEAAERELAAW